MNVNLSLYLNFGISVPHRVDASSDEESMSSEEEEPTSTPQVDPQEVELPEIGSLVYMYVTHVQSPKNICMRNIDGDSDKILMSMEDDLTDFVKDSGTPLSSVQVNFLIGKFVVDRKMVYSNPSEFIDR